MESSNGERLTALDQLQTQGAILVASPIDALYNATAYAGTFVAGGQLYQNRWYPFTDWSYRVTEVFWICLWTYLSASMAVNIISMVVVALVLFTEQRRWKNIAHISWFSSSLIFLTSATISAFFGLCSVMVG